MIETIKENSLDKNKREPVSLSLRYFAILREQRGIAEETIVTTASTALELYNELARIFHFTLPPTLIRVAVNDHFESMNRSLQNGDKIVFIPPVAGG